METVLSAINTWKELIIKVFGEYPLAGAIVTLIAIGIFAFLEKQVFPGKTLKNVLLVLLGWAITVPIVGLAITILSKIWDFIETTIPWLAKLLGSLYEIYSHHPYLVLAIVVIAVIGYFAWGRLAPRRTPNRLVRAALVVVLAVVIVHIAAPIADQVAPAKALADTTAKKTN